MNSNATRVKIVILGAGFGGLGMGVKLRQSGEHDFVILERDDAVGGTWAQNRYPGCACDVPSRLYWPSFVRQPAWTRAFASQSEILANIQQMVVEEGLECHLRLGREVTATHWDDTRHLWSIETASGERYEADMFVCAAGQLSAPKQPDIPGLSDFAGDSFHSAQWRDDVDLTDKRVGVIGSGASAIQIVPQVAKSASQLSVFQRSAPYVMRKNDVVFEPDELALVENQEKVHEIRDEMLRMYDERVQMFAPNSDGPEIMRNLAAQELAAQVTDPTLRRQLTADHAFGCKRPLLSDDYLPTFNQSHVNLVTTSIARIEASGVRTTDGQMHELDALIFATGFDALNFLKGIDIRGRNGLSLHADAWKIAPEAHKGITVSGFPGFFMIFGPNTNYVSVLAIMEHQFDFVLRAVDLLARDGVLIEPKPQAQTHYNEWLQGRLKASPFSADCGGYYKHPSGRVTSNWWGALSDYAILVEEIDPEEYRFTRCASKTESVDA